MNENEDTSIEPRIEHCLNCEKRLSNERYCPDCGQLNVNKNITIWSLFQDFMGDYFSFDSKFFTTLIPLFTKPGQVPLEFLQGKRIRHIPPFRILIFSSFLFFFIWGLTFNPDEKDPRRISSFIKEEIAKSDVEVEQVKDSLSLALDSLTLLPQSIEADIRLGRFQADLKELEQESNGIFKFTGDDSVSTKSRFINKIVTILRMVEEGNSIKLAVDTVAKDNTANEKKVLTQIAKVSTSDRGTLIKYFIGNLSLIILIIQPFLALLLKLIYIRKRQHFKYIGHLIFSFYFHAWVLVLFTLFILIKQIWEGMPLAAFVLIPSMIYLLLAVRRYYGQGWPKTVLKTLLIALGYLCFIAPFFLFCSFAASFYFF
jgi:hypothetical protein